MTADQCLEHPWIKDKLLKETEVGDAIIQTESTTNDNAKSPLIEIEVLISTREYVQ